MSTDLVKVNHYYGKLESEVRSYKDFMESLSRDQIRASNQNAEQITSAVVNANYATQNALKNLDQSMLAGFHQMSSGLANVSREIGYMNSNMSLGFARLGDAIEESTRKITKRLDTLNHIVNNPALTKSRELYNRAVTNYNKSYYEEAAEDLQKAIVENKTDYMAWFLLGKTYLFGVSKFVNIIDLDKAIEYFTTAAKYIDSDAETHAEAKLMAAEIWFFLGLAQHNKAIDLLHHQDTAEYNACLKKAHNSFSESYSYSSNMLESLYYVAKCKVNINDEKGAIDALTTLVIKDKEYFLKAFTDTDFNGVDGFMDRLSDDVKSKIYPKLKSVYDSIMEIFTEIKEVYSVDVSDMIADIPKTFTLDIPVLDMIYAGKILFPRVHEKLVGKRKDLAKKKEEEEQKKEEQKKEEQKKKEQKRKKEERKRKEIEHFNETIEKLRKEAKKIKDQAEMWKSQGKCIYCGGEIKGWISKKCAECAKSPSDPLIYPTEPKLTSEPIQHKNINLFSHDYIVLDIWDNRALLLSKDIIGFRAYHSTEKAITWADCDLRKYLNGEFLNKLPEAIKTRISEVNNVNQNNQWYGGGRGGINTFDKVFLLSISEVVKYFGDSGQLKNRPSGEIYIGDKYDQRRIANYNGTASEWRLRSPGYRSYLTINVRSDGYIFMNGIYVHSYKDGGVRPAFWLNL